MPSTSLSRFRLIALLEGISFLVLLFIAMPLKYWAGWPLAVKYVGWAHGILFIAYFILLVNVVFDYKWGFKKIFLAALSSLFPFGTFILDAKVLKREEVKH